METRRERFDAEELAACLRHYDLGVIRSIREFPRGSRRSPKLLIQSDRGRFLFKRRSPSGSDPAKVAFTHELQQALAARNFPLPHLIPAKDDGETMLVLDGRIYEMFEYIEGHGYDGSLDATYHSGRSLALYHKLLEDFRSDYQPPRGSYHGASSIQQSIGQTVGSLPTDTRPPQEILTATVRVLEQNYRHCAQKADEAGLDGWDSQIAHGDWHPGNMLFHHHQVVAVIDYDAARDQQRVIDVANGALQFSIIGGTDDLSKWPGHLDESRFKRFVRGYESVNLISRGEVQVIPYLMCEAMIAESVLPIAATGSFGRMEGFPFLLMVERKVRWILGHLDELYAAMAE